MGLVLHRLGNRVAIKGSGDVDGDLVASAVRSHLNRDGLNITEMRLLRRILDDDTSPQPTNSEQVALGVLANAASSNPMAPAAGRSTPTSPSASVWTRNDRSDSDPRVRLQPIASSGRPSPEAHPG